MNGKETANKCAQLLVTMSLQITFCIALLLPMAAAAQATKTPEPLYTQLSRTVIRLQEDRLVQPDPQSEPRPTAKPLGTGFFVGTEFGSYVVTARHVVEASTTSPYSLVPAQDRKSLDTVVVRLELPRDRWKFHPNEGGPITYYGDVAVMRVPIMTDYSVVSFAYCPNKCAEGVSNQLTDDPQPPEMVYIFGFPLDIGFTLTEPRPMARVGIVSLTADEAFLKDKDGKFYPKGVYVVDARMFGGNSGGPVFNKALLGSAINLRGLVTGTSRGADFGVITPVSRIIETLESAREQTTEDFHPWKIIR